jgi:broad specificity phosphatase PhoE
VLYSASARTSETAEEIARGLGTGLGNGNCPGRVSAPHAEPAIRNFQFILQGREFWPTDGMHPSLPASAAQNPDLQAFWDAVQDPIACWLNRPSDSWQSSHSVAMRLAAFFRTLLGTLPPAVYVLVTHSGPMRALLREGLGFDPGEPDFCESFRVDDGGVHYRDYSGPLPNLLGEGRNAR